MENKELREKIEQLYDYATGISAWNTEDRKPQWIGKLLELIQSEKAEEVAEFAYQLSKKFPTSFLREGATKENNVYFGAEILKIINQLLDDYQKGTHAND